MFGTQLDLVLDSPSPTPFFIRSFPPSAAAVTTANNGPTSPDLRQTLEQLRQDEDQRLRGRNIHAVTPIPSPSSIKVDKPLKYDIYRLKPQEEEQWPEEDEEEDEDEDDEPGFVQT